MWGVPGTCCRAGRDGPPGAHPLYPLWWRGRSALQEHVVLTLRPSYGLPPSVCGRVHDHLGSARSGSPPGWPASAGGACEARSPRRGPAPAPQDAAGCRLWGGSDPPRTTCGAAAAAGPAVGGPAPRAAPGAPLAARDHRDQPPPWRCSAGPASVTRAAHARARWQPARCMPCSAGAGRPGSGRDAGTAAGLCVMATPGRGAAPGALGLAPSSGAVG